MKRIVYSNDVILAMCNIRGKKVKNPHNLPFSFYFSSKSGVSYSIRVKPVFNAEELKVSMTGTLKLSDDWELIPGPGDANVSSKSIEDMKSFFLDYFVLFAAVWDEQLQDGVLQDYLQGEITFKDMLKNLDFYEDYSKDMYSIETVSALESFCRKHNLVNFYGN